MSELQAVCSALDGVIAPMPSLVSTLQQRARRMQSLAAEIGQAAAQAGDSTLARHVVDSLYQAANATLASAQALSGAAQHGRAFIQRNVGGADATGAGRPGGPGSVPWPGTKFGLAASPTASGGVNLLPATDRAGQLASELPGVAGFTDVIIHGNEHEFGTHDGPGMTPDDLAAVVSATPSLQGRPLRLLSCSTGALDDGAAQRLANLLGQTILAPTDIVHLGGRPGRVRMSVGPNPSSNTGRWRHFYPEQQ